MGSNPARRAIYLTISSKDDIIFNIKLRDLAQLGRASGLGPEGHRFESCSPDHLNAGVVQRQNFSLPS